MKRINIITYADDNYLQHACLMMLSLLDVLDYSRHYKVYVLYSKCEPTSLQKFKDSLDNRLPPNLSYELQECDYNMESQLQAKDSHLSPAIYNKLFIYNELPQDLEKVLFLDADIILLRDPAEIYELDLNSRVVAAVHEPVIEILPDRAREAIGVADSDYFNSGVMLVNLPQWKAQQVSEKSLKFCKEKWDETPYHDQDAFNHVIDGNWLELSPLWNPRISNRLKDSSGKEISLSRMEVYSKNLSYLVHYSGPAKPWFYMSFHPRKKLYLDYLKKSEFRDYQFPDFSASNLLKRQVLKVRRTIYFFNNGSD